MTLAEFVKDVLKPGTFRVGQTEINVTDADMRRWVENFNAMKTVGLRVGVPWEHPDVTSEEAFPVSESDKRKLKERERAKFNAGWTKDLFIDGDTLKARIDIPRAEDASKLAEIGTFVSPQFGSFTDGKGRRWENAIGHIALTTKPVSTDQTSTFSRVEASALSVPVQFSLADIVDGEQVQMGRGGPDHSELTSALSKGGVSHSFNGKFHAVPKTHSDSLHDAMQKHGFQNIGGTRHKDGTVLTHWFLNKGYSGHKYTSVHHPSGEAHIHSGIHYSHHQLSVQMSEPDETTPEPEAKPEVPVLPNMPSADDKVMEALRTALAGLNIILPSTCKLSGDLDVLLSAVASAQAATQAAESKQGDDSAPIQKEASSVNMSTTVTPSTSPEVVELSRKLESQNSQIAALQAQATKSGQEKYTARAKALFDSGRCLKTTHDRLIDSASQFQFSIGQGEDTPLDVELRTLESLPEGTFWTADEKVTHFSVTREKPSEAFFNGTEVSDERANEIIAEMHRNPNRHKAAV